MAQHLVFALALSMTAEAGLFASRQAKPVRDEVLAVTTLEPGRGLVLRSGNEQTLRTFASTSLGLGEAVALERSGQDFTLTLGLFAPAMNAAWLSKIGPVRVLPDERGGISVSAATCAEVDRAGLLIARLHGERSPAQSFDQSARACRMDVTTKLPARIAETLGTIRPGVNGLNAALYAAGLTERPGRSGTREVRDAIDQQCHRRAGAPEFGDLVVIFDAAPLRGAATPLHAYVHLADDLAFEKPGRAGIEPYWFTPSMEILAGYEVSPLDQFPTKPSAVGRRLAVAYGCTAR